MPLKQMTANREYKNNLFIYLFTKKKEYALSLYNAVNQSSYTNEENLQFKLLEYTQFVEMVKRNAETMDLKEAMVCTINECLEKGILVGFFQEYRKEMGEMSWRIYDTERILQIQHEEALEDAREEGLRLGLEEGRAKGRAEGRAEAEHTIFLLKQEIENLKRKACTFGQSVLE